MFCAGPGRWKPWTKTRSSLVGYRKKVVITDYSSVQYLAEGGCGPDCQCFHGPASGILYVTMVVYVEDAVTLLGSSLVTLTAGKAYSLVLKSGK